MQMPRFLPFLISLFIPASFALHLPAGDKAVRTIYQFPNKTWVENFALRSNGDVLVSLITSPEVWNIDLVTQSAELIHHFPDAACALGMAEYEHDTFAVLVGNWSAVTGSPTPGSWSVWGIDFHARAESRAKKITDIPEAVFLNGATLLDSSTMLAGDAGQGVIYRINIHTGAYSIAISDPLLVPNPDGVFQLGVNGIHIRPDAYTQKPFLYFTNSLAAPLLARFPLAPNGSASGPAEVLVKVATYPVNAGVQSDDFTFDKEGNVWMTTDASNTLVKISADGRTEDVELGGTEKSVVAGCTAAEFGRTKRDDGVLYISTNGGIPYPPTGGVVGGKVLAIEGLEG